MGFFDQAYDEMSWKEICYRLPSELAVQAIARRVTNLETLRMLFDNVGSKISDIKPLKSHINSIITDAKLDDIFATFSQEYHPILFNWLDQSNIERIKGYGTEKLSTKFLFNITDSKDEATLNMIMQRVLTDAEFNQSQVRAILRKAEPECVPSLIDTILKDKRPEVVACVLCVPGSNADLVSDHQKVIGLKALAKCDNLQPISNMSVLNINVFNNLRPLERITALEKYMSYFPLYRRVPVFNPEPTEEEFQMILFAGCIEYNDRVVKLHELYKQITQQDPPAESEEDDIP